MDYYYDLEEKILECLLLRPKNMDDLLVEEKHFIKNKPLFKFLKTFYATYGNLDINIMMAVCPNKFTFFPKLNKIITNEFNISAYNCREYQSTIIKLFDEEQSERKKIVEIYDLTNELVCRSITVKEFLEKVNDKIENEEE